MKWKAPSKPSWPPDEAKRIQSKFLWLPTTAVNIATDKQETRWLEYATYIVEVVYWVNSFTKRRTNWSFEPVEWIDTPEQLAFVRASHSYRLNQYSQWAQEAQ